MPAERTCPRCGTALSPDALEGLCPTCVGRAAFANASLIEKADAAGEPMLSPEIEANLARLKPEEVGDQIGQYKLMEQIGQGGFGTVWVANQEKPVRRQVALKIIKLGMDTKEVIARFEQERQALAMMDHPHIAKVFDAGATQWGRPYFVMELVRGIKITDYCDQANLPTADRLALFIQVCNAVQHAHQKGIIHRDLKPSNILVTINDGEAVPKVIDFGVAKATQGRLTEHTVYTQFQQMIGTPLYMSPEQAEMTSLDIDTRSDIYSLGVLLYELLAGRTPFDPEELMKQGLDEIRRAIREQEPQKPSTFLSTMAFELRTNVAQHRQVEGVKLVGLIRGDLDWIVMKALEKDRARRYETASGLARDIERHLASEPVQARPASRVYRFRRLVKRNRLAFTAAAVVTVSLLTGLGFSTWSFLRAQAALHDLADTAPEFVARARELFREERFDEAISKVDFAIQLDPHSAEFRLAKADLFEALLKFSEAGNTYKEVLAFEPGNARAVRHKQLCEELVRERAGDGTYPLQALSKLIATISAECRSPAEQLAASRLIGAQSEPLRQLWLDRLRVFAVKGKPLEERLRLLPNGNFKLDLSGQPVSDLAPLGGMPLEKLDLSLTSVIDLRPLAGTQLRELNLSNTPVQDLSPLAGLQIESLNISYTRVESLEPLRGMPLRVLDAYWCSISNLEPLANAPLANLRLGNARCTSLAPLASAHLHELLLANVPVNDLSPLEGMPLEVLDLSAVPVGDLSPLAALPLKKLALRRVPRRVNLVPVAACAQLEALITPADSEGLDTLRKLRALARISDTSEDGWPETTAAEFWRRWEPLNAMVKRVRPHIHDRELSAVWESSDTSVGDLAPLEPIRSEFSAENRVVIQMNRDDTFDLHLNSAGLEHIAFLSGLPLRRLSLKGNPIHDLTPLAGMKLRALNIDVTGVSDLSPLRDMPLGELHIGVTPVRDIEALRGMPMRLLSMWNCEVSDLSPLAGMSLELLMLSGTKVRDLSPLRGLPLRKIFLNDCKEAIDMSLLADLPALREVLLPPHPVNLDSLRRLTELSYLSFDFDSITKLPSQTTAAFWARIDDQRDPAVISETLTATFKATEPIAVRLRADGMFDIDLSRRSISDLTPLAGLKIGALNLSQTGARDLAPLHGMPLRELSLAGTPVTDLSPLAGMSLRQLSLADTPITDLAPLTGMPLIDLDLRGTHLQDITPLKGLPLLRLVLRGTKISDLTPLRGAPLVELDLEETPVRDLTPLSGAPLQHLNAERTLVESLVPLQGMPLEDLKLARTLVRDLGPLAKMPLTLLFLGDTKVHDLEPLRGLPLRNLNLWHTSVTDLSPLADSHLNELGISETQVRDLAPLRGLPLRRLDCWRTPVRDLTPLAEAPLKELLIHETEVTDLTPLRNVHLEALNVAMTGISDLKPLAELPLRELYMDHCPALRDISPLRGSRTLESVTLPPKPADISFLRDIPSIRRISQDWDPKAPRPAQTVQEFWQEYDTKK